MQRLSVEVTPPGIFFTVSRPAAAAYRRELPSGQERVIVYLDQISDAGNLGTILRSMNWFGLKSLVLSPGCVDPYNPKSVRASAGAVFGAYIYPNLPLDHLVKQLKPHQYRLVAATPQGGQSVEQIDLSGKIVLVFGSEANGLSESTLARIDHRITIPRLGCIESLNLAVSAGIVFYQITRGAETVPNHSSGL
jgi:TrmH family RNA methyltransferase